VQKAGNRRQGAKKDWRIARFSPVSTSVKALILKMFQTTPFSFQQAAVSFHSHPANNFSVGGWKLKMWASAIFSECGVSVEAGSFCQGIP
jgi:hypothetical protein